MQLLHKSSGSFRMIFDWFPQEEYMIVAHVAKKFPFFMEHNGLLPCIQQRVFAPYP
jgi:hypothetical protein